MARSALRLAVVAAFTAAGLVAGCGGGGQDDEDVVVSIGSLGDLAAGPTTRPIEEAFNDGDCGAIPRTSDVGEAIGLTCDAGASGDPEAYAIALDKVDALEIDPTDPRADELRELKDALRPELEERVESGGPLKVRMTAEEGSTPTAPDTTTDTTGGPDPAPDTGSTTPGTDVPAPDTTVPDTTVPATTVP